ncbi:MAG: tyrosine-type recombinase/integrase [Betaproteobacteria bacterium]|nr:tyrosine-type recombinase/integrase [Betaproteobacteria bacterium]
MPYQLTARKVQSLTSKPGMHRVATGLYLRVTPTLRSYWMLRYFRNGKATEMSLGYFDALTLHEAVAKSHTLRMTVKSGNDPLKERRALMVRKQSATFREVAKALIEAKRPGWKCDKHASQWESTLQTYVFPVIGDMDVAIVDTAHILEILTPIWTTKAETATRVRQRIEAVLNAAAARKLRSRDNPAAWKGHLDTLLAVVKKKSRVVHHPCMPWDEVPDYMPQLRANGSISAMALEFCILTSTRTSETIKARWEEIDFKKEIWTVPGTRMKGGESYRVPLTEPMIRLLKSVPRFEGSDFIFNGAKQGKPLSNMAMLNLLQGTQPDITVHGFRSSFRDWAGESTNFPSDVVEMCLSHKIKGETQAAYQRGDLFVKRRKVMAAWNDYLYSGKRSKVVMIKEAA